MKLHPSVLWPFFLTSLVSQVSSEFTKWIDDVTNPGYNCAKKVTDAVCCTDTFCAGSSQRDCLSGDKQFVCSWSNGQCVPYRDKSNNVCCQSEVKEACDKVARGLCPSDWQVPERCCSPLGQKYNGTLVGVRPGFVCCNAPCTEMQANGCPLPVSCAPGQRSLDYAKRQNKGPPHPRMLGFGYDPIDQFALGQVNLGTGLGGDYALSALESLKDGRSKKQHVDEITVDDLMNMLIDSLSADQDVMVYNSELNSDPYMGKLASGGKQAGMNLPDPNLFLDNIYGNPFGLSMGNIGNFPSLSNPFGQPGAQFQPPGFPLQPPMFNPMFGPMQPSMFNPMMPPPNMFNPMMPNMFNPFGPQMSGAFAGSQSTSQPTAQQAYASQQTPSYAQSPYTAQYQPQPQYGQYQQPPQQPQYGQYQPPQYGQYQQQPQQPQYGQYQQQPQPPQYGQYQQQPQPPAYPSYQTQPMASQPQQGGPTTGGSQPALQFPPR